MALYSTCQLATVKQYLIMPYVIVCVKNDCEHTCAAALLVQKGGLERIRSVRTMMIAACQSLGQPLLVQYRYGGS